MERETAPDGRIVERPRTYQELATGMHFKNAQDQWEESQEKIEVLPNNAGAVASKGQHKVIFPPEIKSGLIEMQTPDGQWLRSRVWGLAYFDSSTGESVLLAEVKESEGQIAGDNVVVFQDAFEGVQADLRYTYSRFMFEQDVMVREQLIDPRLLNMNPATTRLAVLTEFVEAPAPVKEFNIVGGKSDVSLRFGEMGIGIGKAFSIDSTGNSGGQINVFKSWTRLESRNFLIEEVEYSDIADELQTLPSTTTDYDGTSLRTRGKGSDVMAALSSHLPPRYAKLEPTSRNSAIEMAKASYRPGPSLVLDYVSLTSSLTNYVFKGDTTYFLSGTVLLYGSSNLLEGNTVLKYAAGASLQVSGQLSWATEDYRPAVLTAKDDNSAGETISGSTGTPLGYYASYALYYNAPSAAVEMRHTLVRHATTGLRIGSGGARTHSVRHCQFLNTDCAVSVEYTTVLLENALLHSNRNAAISAWYSTVRGVHVTANRVSTLLASAPTTAFFTNSLFVNVTNWPTSFTSVNNATNNSAGTFQAVGGGAAYLAENSPYRDQGSTNINPTLLEELKKLTTYPPVAFTNVEFTSQMTFVPQAQRDHDVPDLGYHYAPLDYTFGGCHAYANLTFTPGTAVGWFRTTSGWQHAGHGIHIGDNKTVTFSGDLLNPCYWVRLNTVQENDMSGGYGPGGLSGWGEERSLASMIRMRFTRCSMLAADTHHMRDDYGTLDVTANDSEFYGGALGHYVSDYALTNCLFYRSAHYLNGGYTNFHRFNYVQNCTFYGGRFYINRWEPGDIGKIKVVVSDTAFDGTSVEVLGYHNNDPALTSYNYNAFLTGSSRTVPQGANDVLVSSFNWQTGTLGNFYLPWDSSLIDVGSRADASTLGMYHYTTQTSQWTETCSPLDIGLHYIATDSNGLPADHDSDKVPNYAEDLNGDGVVNSGETDWIFASDTGLKVRIVRPDRNAPLP